MTTSYQHCKYILIDGSSLEGGWLTQTFGCNKEGRAAKYNYQLDVLRLLDQLMTRIAGWAVINAIYNLGIHKGTEVRIVPYGGQNGPGNSGTAATGWMIPVLGTPPERNATPHGVIPGFEAGVRGGGEGNWQGTGRGSSAEIIFSPTGSLLSPCSAANPDPSTTNRCTQTERQADDTLLHEMVHAVRIMAGLLNPIPTPEKKTYDHEEEFFAILVQNIYMSETGRTRLAGDHKEKVITEEMNDSERFLGKGKATPDLEPEERLNRRLVNKFVSLHTNFAADLAKSPAPFNPVRAFRSNPTAYPLA
jgi:hypothetical protein